METPAATVSQSAPIPDFVTKDMLIGEVVARYPQAVDVFLRHGLHCVGCHISPYESVYQGSKGHGMADGEIADMLAEVNAVVSEQEKQARAAENNGEIPPAISLTARAAGQLKKLMSAEGKAGSGLRVLVQKGGCAGSSYEMEFEAAPKEDDVAVAVHGISVFFSKDLEPLIAGTSIDFRESLQGSGFTMRNPNAKRACGCGSSFGV